MTLQERLAMREALMGYDPLISLTEEQEQEIAEEVTVRKGKTPLWKREELQEVVRAEGRPSTSRERAVRYGALGAIIPSMVGGFKVGNKVFSKTRSPALGSLATLGTYAAGVGAGAGIGAGINKASQSKKDRQLDLKKLAKYSKNVGDEKLYQKTKEKLDAHKKKYGNLAKNESISLVEDINKKDFVGSSKVNIEKGKYNII